MEELIARIEKEMEDSKLQYIPEIGKIVINHVLSCPPDAFCVTSGKTLQGCFEFLKERAKKNQENGCGVAGDADIFDYFGFAGEITVKPQANADLQPSHVNISDLFE
jgi:hypothetical protein